MTVAVAFVPDLMDRSRLARVPGVQVHFVAAPGELAAASTEREADVVLVDLGRPGAVAALAAGGMRGRIVAFGSHVDRELLEAATAAGADEVLPRSRFFAELADRLA